MTLAASFGLTSDKREVMKNEISTTARSSYEERFFIFQRHME